MYKLLLNKISIDFLNLIAVALWGISQDIKLFLGAI